jgi:hypothetical protein
MLKDENGIHVESPIHAWFSLSYCSYFTVPRLALQEMSLDWQKRFVALMDEAGEVLRKTPEYEIRRRTDTGKFMRDPWADYRRGTVAEAVAEEKRLKGK